MTTLKLLESAEIVPVEVLGGSKSIRNRKEFSRKVATHARVRLVWCWILVALIIAICVGGLVLAFTCAAGLVSKGLPTFLGGPAFIIALLSATVHTMNSYSEDRMTLLVLEHGTDAQAADYIEILLDAKRQKIIRARAKR